MLFTRVGDRTRAAAARSASATSPTASCSRGPRRAPRASRCGRIGSIVAVERHPRQGPAPSGRQQLPQLARLGATRNGSADLLAVIGLQPTAADYFQRIADDLRPPVQPRRRSQTGGDRMDDVFESVFAGIAAQLDPGRSRLRHAAAADGTLKPYPLLFQLIHQRHQTLHPADLADRRPAVLGDRHRSSPTTRRKTKNYIDWLARQRAQRRRPARAGFRRRAEADRAALHADAARAADPGRHQRQPLAEAVRHRRARAGDEPEVRSA